MLGHLALKRFLCRPEVALTLSLAAMTQPAEGELQGLTRIGTGFNSPVFVTHAPGDTGRLFVVEQSGIIRTLDLASGNTAPQPFLNIQSFVDSSGNEQGLLGLAFAPDYQTTGHFYVNYVRDPGPGLDRTRVDRFTTLSPSAATPASVGTRQSVLEFDQDFSNHNGGWIDFGLKDGLLYIATGDGGSGNDPNNRSQRLDTRLGKILRVDPTGDDFPSSTTENYRVPNNNPFVDTSGLNEIWAYGLRNPWRNSFDRQTGDLWIGDVGQGAREEINFQPADSLGGENYGWRLREGDIATPGATGGPEPNDHTAPFTTTPQTVPEPLAATQPSVAMCTAVRIQISKACIFSETASPDNSGHLIRPTPMAPRKTSRACSRLTPGHWVPRSHSARTSPAISTLSIATATSSASPPMCLSPARLEWPSLPVYS